METEFYRQMQKFVVNAYIDSSTLQRLSRQGGKNIGTLGAVRNFLCTLNLSVFADAQCFAAALDEETKALRYWVKKSLPLNDELSWGHARKCLNIILRDATYSHYLRPKFGLDGVEKLLEVPLDSDVAADLRRDAKAYKLGPTPGGSFTIKGLTPDISLKWQATAKAIAEKKGVARVHLDIWYWERRRR
jgi:hypothetical protein